MLISLSMFHRFIYLVACIRTSFLFKTGNYSVIHIHTAFSLSVRSLVDVWIVSTVWLLRIKLLWTLVYRYLFESCLLLLGVRIGVELQDYMIILCLTFWKTTNCFPQWLHPFYIATSSAQGFQFPHILAKIYSLFLWVWELCFGFCFKLWSAVCEILVPQPGPRLVPPAFRV